MNCKHERDRNRELIKREPAEKRTTYWYPCRHCDKSIVVVFEDGKMHKEGWKDNRRIAAKAAKLFGDDAKVDHVITASAYIDIGGGHSIGGTASIPIKSQATMPSSRDLVQTGQAELF